MDDRTCDRCRKVFKYPAHLREHQNRKTPCAPILDVKDLPEDVQNDPDIEKKKCRFCGRAFSSYDSMRRHVRTACKIAPNAKNGDSGMEKLYEHTLKKQAAEISELKAMMTQLLAQGRGDNAITGGEVGVQATGDQAHIAVDNSKKVVNINVFGKEGLDHVTMERIKGILDDSLRLTAPGTAAPQIEQAADTAVLKAALLVYSDPDIPENLTCYRPNKKLNDALVHVSRNGAAVWEVQPTKLVLPGMAQKSIDALFDNQPYEDADQYAPLMTELRDNEARYAAGGELRPVLVRNKDLLQRALKALPTAGC